MKNETEYQQLIDFYGVERQVDKSIEKMSELTIGLLSRRIDGSSLMLEGRADIASKISSVENILQQLKMIFLIEKDVDKIRPHKLKIALNDVKIAKEKILEAQGKNWP